MRRDGNLNLFKFNGYRRMTYSSMNRQENPLTPEWEESQPIIELDYICPDDRPYHDEDEHVYLTIPEIWLDQDWRALEKARLQAYREQKARAKERWKAEQEVKGLKF